MNQESPQAIYLKDYRPPDYSIASIDLRFELGQESTVVTSLMQFEANFEPGNALPPLVLAGEQLELLEVVLDDEVLTSEQYQLDESGLRLQPGKLGFRLAITTRIYPQNNVALEGLYQSGSMFCTQCEAEGFRRITYYLDRPDVMAIFTTTIVADKVRYPVLLSNGNPVGQGELEDGRHWVKWHDPFRKPCYLFALVAGDLKCHEDRFVTRSGRTIDLRLYVEPENIDKCGHAMASLQKAMQWDEQVFGLEYDLDIYMIVAVNDFNMGAMENKGLNIFNTAYVLAKPDTATDDDYLGIESVIAHEYFHNWTGNRVTCRDWFQLSLKEGLTVFRDQEFSADMGLRDVMRIGDVRILRAHQFPEDSGPMAHPVRPDSYIEINNFYTMTVYNKGAEVIRMYQTLLGKQGFRKGMDLYFQRHDGQAVTTDDFCAAMADANDYDLSQFRRWYSQAGTPVVRIEGEYDAAAESYTLHLSQQCADTPGQDNKKPFLVPVAIGLLDQQGRDMPLKSDSENFAQGVIKLETQEAQVRFSDIGEQPVPSLLRQFSAPVIVQYEYSDADLAFLWSHDNDDFNRWEAGQRLLLRAMLDRVENGGGESFVLDETIAEAVERILGDEKTNNAMRAELLQLPSEAYIGEQMAQIDVDGIHFIRQQMRKAIATRFQDKLANIYQQLQDGSTYRFDMDSVANRRLKNCCLGYLMEITDASLLQACHQQYMQSDNMTDTLAALSAIVNHDNPLREELIEDFYRKWRHEPLVLDKWFALQATCRLPGALGTVESLLQHEAFSIKNPNKVRALIGSFCRANIAQFHDVDGAGYRFLADRVIEIDSFNPQIAARLAGIFSQWRKYDTRRQQAMQAQLQRIVDSRALSADVYEIASKSLA